jgi:hypothetical protein
MIIITLCRSWLMKMMVQLVRDAMPVNLRSACDISRAWPATWQQQQQQQQLVSICL